MKSSGSKTMISENKTSTRGKVLLRIGVWTKVHPHLDSRVGKEEDLILRVDKGYRDKKEINQKVDTIVVMIFFKKKKSQSDFQNSS